MVRKWGVEGNVSQVPSLYLVVVSREYGSQGIRPLYNHSMNICPLFPANPPVSIGVYGGEHDRDLLSTWLQKEVEKNLKVHSLCSDSKKIP